MNSERFPSRTPETEESPDRLIALAGALQAIINELPLRNIELEEHQEEALQAIGESLLNGDIEGYIEAATSSGKTLLISLLTEAAMRAGLRVLMLAPTTQICDQLIGESGQTGLGKFTELPIADCVKRHYSGKRGNATSPIVTSTYSGFLHETKAIAKNRGRLGHFDIILGDECHESLGTETSAALHHYGRGIMKLGFSATPDYAEDRKSEEVYGKPLFEFPLDKAIDARITAPIRPLLYATDTRLETAGNGRDFTEAELAPLIDNPVRNGTALQLAQDFVTDGRQGIVACVPGSGNLHAQLMASLLSKMKANGEDIVARDIGSHLSKEEYDRRLALYEEGEIDILTFTRAIEKGWDSTRASFAINLVPTTSSVRITQLLGRVLRKNKDGRESIFVDFLDERSDIGKKQYTAFHALKLKEIDTERILGWGDARKYAASAHVTPSLPLRPELLEHLTSLKGTLIDEAVLGEPRKPAVDPRFAQWERKLAKEGMPAELPGNIAFTPQLDAEYRKAETALVRDSGEVPDSDEVADYLDRKISKEKQNFFRLYGSRVLDSLETLHGLPDDNHESVEDIVIRLNLKDVLTTILDTLSEREAGIVSLRVGMPDGEEKKLDEIGRIYGITRERVRQIYIKAESKLRHPTRADKVRDFLTDNPPKESIKTPSQSHDAFPSTTELPVIDMQDTRPYIERLKEMCYARAETWLIEKRAHLNDLGQQIENNPESGQKKYRQQLQHEQLRTRQERDTLEIMQRRILRRPSDSLSSEQSRLATLISITTRLQAIHTYEQLLEEHIQIIH